jgi:5-formyltetrahydrofolate cyclo-ligase
MSIATEQKARIRTDLQRLYTQKDLSTYTRDAVRQLTSSLVWKRASEVLAYAPLSDELQCVWELMKTYPEKSWFFPRVHDDAMEFVRVHSQQDFRVGTFGIQEPVGNTVWQPRAHVDTVCVVPAQALDSTGSRLGRGKGFYDRFLGAHTNDMTTISIVPDFAFVRDIPTETHDVRIDFPLKACCST